MARVEQGLLWLPDIRLHLLWAQHGCCYRQLGVWGIRGGSLPEGFAAANGCLRGGQRHSVLHIWQHRAARSNPPVLQTAVREDGNRGRRVEVSDLLPHRGGGEEGPHPSLAFYHIPIGAHLLIIISIIKQRFELILN